MMACARTAQENLLSSDDMRRDPDEITLTVQNISSVSEGKNAAIEQVSGFSGEMSIQAAGLPPQPGIRLKPYCEL